MKADRKQQRIIELQRALKIARMALERIKAGTALPHSVADEALYAMLPLEKPRPLQGLVGHGPNA